MSSTSTAISSESVAAKLAAEIQHEADSSKRCLERIPADKFSWKPHEKSMEMGKLASHVAEMFSWTSAVLPHSELDFAKMDYTPFDPQSTDDLVEFLNKSVNEAIETLSNTPDEAFLENWTLRKGDDVYFTLPKIAVMRDFVINHIIHHRAQLTVYMRLNDIPVPGLYGPSADEPTM